MSGRHSLLSQSISRIVLALLVVLTSGHAFADSIHKKVLVLHFTGRDAPAYAGVNEAYRKTLAQALGDGLDYYSEYVDLIRFSDAAYQSAIAQYLSARYAGEGLDLIIAASPGVVRFLQQSPPLVPDVPIVFTSLRGVGNGPDSTGIVSVVDFKRTLGAALAAQPDTTAVYVVSGASTFDRSYADLMRAQTRELTGRVAFTYLSGLTLPDLERRLRTLPKHSIVFYVSITNDGAGHNVAAVEVLDRLAEVANAPIYSWHEAALGHGIVGGRLHSSIQDAVETAKVALRVLNGEKPEAIPVHEIDAETYRFDWRQLRRWRIAEARLPRGSVVAFREPTVWDRYGGYLVAVAALLLLQSAMIGALLFQRSRRRRAEDALTVKEADLRRSFEQTRSLAGRVLTAQEVERARIARELHDDVSEGLAALSLEVHGLKKTRGLIQGDALQPTLAALQQGIAGVADRIRTLSHELHPEIIHHVGLVAALASHCQEIQGRHGLPVTFAVRDDGGFFSPDAELCLFRIAQEVLRNTFKHAKAHAAHVTLGCDEATVELSIEDDGVGFDLARARRQDGLGLLSIDERVRLLNGSASIETAPGAGTRVRVRVPRAATSGRLP